MKSLTIRLLRVLNVVDSREAMIFYAQSALRTLSVDINARSINVNGRARTFVSSPFRCVSRIEMSTLDTASITYGQPRERRSFPNAECERRTCVDSDLEVRLPGRTGRPLRSGRSARGRLFPSPIFLKVTRARKADGRFLRPTCD